MNWFKISFNDVFFNGLTTAEVGCVVKYKCMCQQLDVKELSLEKLRTIFNSRELKFVQKYFGLCSDFDRSLSGVCSESVQSLSGLCSEFAQSLPEVCSEKDNKNKDLACARICNNNKNNTYIKERKKREKERENIGGEPPKSDYVFEGKIIRLKQKDFDQWQKAYPDLNLRAELLQRDLWLQQQPPDEQKKWFLTTSQYFIKRNEIRKAQNAEIAEQYGEKPAPDDDWF